MIGARNQQKLIVVRFFCGANKNVLNSFSTYRTFSSVNESSYAEDSTTVINENNTVLHECSELSQKERMKQETTRAHQIRQEQQQQSKQERLKKKQKEHIKLTLIQKLQSTISTQKNRRSEAAKAIGPLFRISTACYQDTMAALDLNTFLPNSKNNNKKLAIKDLNSKKNSRKSRRQSNFENDDNSVMQHNNGLNFQYRKLYMSSINSFVHCLQTNPSSLFPVNSEDRGELQQPLSSLLKHPAELEKALVNLQDFETILSSTTNNLTKAEALLEELVECGFNDGRFGKQYRNRKVHESTSFRIRKRIKQKELELERRFARLQSCQAALEQASDEFQIKKLERKNALESKKEESIVNSLLESFTDLFSSSEKNQPHQIDEHGRRLSSASARRKVHKEDVSNLKMLDSKVKEAKRLIRNTKNSILRLESEIEYPSHSLQENTFNEVNEVMSRVLKELCPSFAEHIRQRHAALVNTYKELDGMTDLTKPHEWYPQARRMKRKIIFHGGATNSGKTYTALQRLKEVEKGLYLGPLRLLAAEVYENLTAAGIATNLYTGQEYIETPEATHLSATAEIGPTNERFDVVVIDEIQMIGDESRGHAWTRALQGMDCKEIHVCGGMEALSIVEKIVQDCGDELEIKNEYKRFSNLIISDDSFNEESGSSSFFFDRNQYGNNEDKQNGYKMVQPGDCVVAFSRNDIFAIKREIESTTNHKCSVIYGSLPPEIRKQQAQRFNDSNSKHNILIASDAIGMGLNLHIRRIIFNSMLKSNGEKIIQLPHTGVKQISGRAGRRNSPYPDGIVTCRAPEDMEYLMQCLNSDIEPIEHAGLLPSSHSIQEFSDALSTFGTMSSGDSTNTNEIGHKSFDDLYVILQKFMEMATLQGDFHLCRQTALLRIAKFLADVPLSLEDKYTFCMCPVKTDDMNQMKLMKDYAYSLSRDEVCGINFTSGKMPESPKSFDDISQLCTIHNEMELFMWLCHRFPENFIFDQSSLAIQERTISLINEGLVNSDILRLDHCYKERDTRIRKNFEERKERELMGESDPNEFVYTY